MDVFTIISPCVGTAFGEFEDTNRMSRHDVSILAGSHRGLRRHEKYANLRRAECGELLLPSAIAPEVAGVAP
jgi:hypothetical protein